MEIIRLTREAARRFLLAHQSIDPPHALQGKSGILTYIRRVNSLQFDPLNIVGHNQELVLQARVADFRPAMLQELLYRDRLLFDQWDKNMSICCIEDWPHFKRHREAARLQLGHSSRPAAAILPQLRKELADRGPLSSADLHYRETVDWSWAPTRLSRAALESMYFWGELVIHHKVHTRKVYDFATRLLPAELLKTPEPNPTEEQYYDWYALRRIGAIGMLWNRSGDAWLGIGGIKSRERNAAFERLLRQQKILEIGVEGIKLPLYIRSADYPVLERVLSEKSKPCRAAVLAPLDNLLWDRRLIKELFAFDYRWEVYKPVEERSYGYYVLPVLCGDRFVARFEPGRDKKNKTLIIKNWWWEPGVRPTAKIRTALRECLQQFNGFLGAEGTRIDEKAAEQAGISWLTTKKKE